MAKKDKSFSDGIKRNLLDDTVAMKSDRSNMCVGIADSGCCASDCLGVCIVGVLIRGSAVVELSRISNVLKPLTRPFLLVTQRSVDLVSRCCSIMTSVCDVETRESSKDRIVLQGTHLISVERFFNSASSSHTLISIYVLPSA